MLTKYSERIQSQNNQQILLQLYHQSLILLQKSATWGQKHLSHLSPAEWAVLCGGQNKYPS